MRAVSLSHPEVISELNRYFVPVFLSNEDYRSGGAAPGEEKAHLRRIHREGHAAKLSVGTVHAFVLAPDGRVLDSLHTVEVARPPALLDMLRRTVRTLGTRSEGGPVVKPIPPTAPSCAPGSLLLHLTARYLERQGDGEYALVENAGGNWSALPSEDWITLTEAEWTRLLPPSKAGIGDTWTVPPGVATRLLLHFYPPTENTDIAKNRTEEQSLTATVVSTTGGTTRAQIEGSLRMKHPFYHKDDDKFVRASLAGTLEFDPAKRRLRSLKLVTVEADYGGEKGARQPFGVAVRSVV